MAKYTDFTTGAEDSKITQLQNIADAAGISIDLEGLLKAVFENGRTVGAEEEAEKHDAGGA